MSLWSGQGPVFWSNRDDDGNPSEFNWFGNAPAMTLGLATSTLTHKESYTGNRTTDARIITELTATVAITTDDFKESNMELATYGEGSAVAGSSVAAEAVLAGAPTVTERYSLKTTGIVTNAVLYDNAVAIDPTFYDVDASGVIHFTDVTGLTGPITADYTIAAARQVGVFKTSAPEIWVRLDGLNTATSVTRGGSSDFERTIVDIYKTRLDPAESFGLINDEFGQLVLNGSALTDTLKSAAAATGQFARFIYLDPPIAAFPSASMSPSVSPSASASPSHSASPSV
jgi:hypothetical protein